MFTVAFERPAGRFYCSAGAASGLFERPTERRPTLGYCSGQRTFYCSGGLVDVSGRSSGQRNFYGRRSSGSLNDRPTFRASDFPFFSILYNGVKCRTYLGLQRMMTCRKGRDETDSPKNSLSTPICFLSSPNFIRSFFLERPPDFSSAGNFIRASNVARISDFSV